VVRRPSGGIRVGPNARGVWNLEKCDCIYLHERGGGGEGAGENSGCFLLREGVGLTGLGKSLGGPRLGKILGSCQSEGKKGTRVVKPGWEKKKSQNQWGDGSAIGAGGDRGLAEGERRKAPSSLCNYQRNGLGVLCKKPIRV